VTFNLFVVTHIDADHIDVPLVLLRDTQIRCRFDDIWFNGWSQIAPDDDIDIFAPLQGEFLASILGDRVAKFRGTRLSSHGQSVCRMRGRCPCSSYPGACSSRCSHRCERAEAAAGPLGIGDS